MKTRPKPDAKLFSQFFRRFEGGFAENSEPHFKELFRQFGAAFKESRDRRVDSTPYLDVLQVFGVKTEDELRHSRVLSWFLDANAEHEQGATFT